MVLEKLGKGLGKEIIAWSRTGSSKSLLATRPVKVNTVGLKYTPKLKSDTLQLSKTSNLQKKIDSRIEIPKKEYDDVVQNMIAQRRNIINTVNDGFPVEVTLNNFKDNYIGVNRDIRNKIMKALGDEDAFYSVQYFKDSTQRLDKLIEQGYIPRDTVLYRGATPYDFGMRDLESKEFIKKFYKKGRLFKIPIYPETTLDKEVGESFAKNRILFKINAPKGTSGIYMEKLGLAKSGYYGNEEEVLLPRDLVYKFKSYTQENGYDLIELDIVKSKPFWKKIHEFWNEI